MTAQSQKTKQKRLDSCVLTLPKWAQTHEKLKNRACGTVKINDFAAHIPLGVENAPENGQVQPKTRSLGKYRISSIFKRS